MTIHEIIRVTPEKWLVFDFRVDLRILFYQYNGKTSVFYKKLTTGNNKFNGTSNHYFFKSFNLGFYRKLHTSEGVVIFRFYLKNSKEVTSLFRKELTIRILKLGGKNIEFKSHLEIEPIEMSIIKSKYSYNIYKKIFDRKLIKR